MPIMVEVVSQEAFEAWLEQAQEEFARAGGIEMAAGQLPN
jgi:heme/copper-type cytochrome/quinol oxidase subunit 2